MKKIKLMLFASAFIVALAGAFAFSMPGRDAQSFNSYHYVSDSDAEVDIKNPLYWEDSGPSCEQTGTVPCAISFADRTELETFLDENGKTAILAASTQRTPNQ